VKVFHSDGASLPLPDGHPFPIAKYGLLRHRVVADGLVDEGELCPAAPAREADLALVHDPDYLARVRSGRLTALEVRRLGFPWSAALVERAFASVGATVAAARAAAAEGVAVTLAGGTHHARRDLGAGYCVFNDVVVAARVAQRDGLARRVVFIDCDVHQGDGTAALVVDDPSCFAFSIHGAHNFPARKVAGDLDVALADGCGDAGYLGALEDGLQRALDASRAELAIYLAGADPYRDDRWGRLALSKEALAARDRMVLSACRARGLATVVTMAGGYAPRVEDIVDIHVATVRTAARLAPGWPQLRAAAAPGASSEGSPG